MSHGARPGSIMPLFDGGYGFVVESSAHRGKVPEAEADKFLMAQYASEKLGVPVVMQTWTFFSHRLSLELWCWCDDPANSWCPNGNGSAWRRVRVPSATVE